MYKAKTPFIFDPQAGDARYADFERATAEGYYSLEALAIDETSRRTLAGEISKHLDRAAALGDTVYNADEENPFVVPSAAISGLRMSLRALVAVDHMMQQPLNAERQRKADSAMREALLAIGNALVTIELPE